MILLNLQSLPICMVRGGGREQPCSYDRGFVVLTPRVVRGHPLCRVAVESSLLLDLTRWCPQLQTLRIGGLPASQAKFVRRALQALAPTTRQPRDAVGSWEDAAGDSSQVNIASLPACQPCSQAGRRCAQRRPALECARMHQVARVSRIPKP